MSNTQKASNPQGQSEAQQAQIDEANDKPRAFEFDGYRYEIADGQPSWIALDYLARYAVDGNNMALVPAIKELIGDEQFRAAASRHTGDQLYEFFTVLNSVAGGGEGN